MPKPHTSAVENPCSKLLLQSKMTRTSEQMWQSMARARKNPVQWSTAVPSREDQFQLKRQALIQEAGKAFGKLGFHNASLDDVARVLGVTKPALYYYVKTKEEILFECKNYALELGERARDQAYKEASTASDRLRLLLTYYIEHLTSEPGTRAVLGEPNGALTAEHREHIIQRRDKFDRQLRELVRAGIAEGAFAPCEPKLAVAFFMGAINAINRWYSAEGELSGKEIARAFVQLTLGGLAGERENTSVRSVDSSSARRPKARAS